MNPLRTREQRDRADGALGEREGELRQLTDAVSQQIFVLGQDEGPLCANQAVPDYTGLTLEGAQAEDFLAKVFHPEDLKRVWGSQ